MSLRREDHETIIRAAGAQGRANGRQAAIARAVLLLLALPAPGDEAEPPADVSGRLDTIEETLRSIELPDLPALEETIAGFAARLTAIEEELGVKSPAPEDEKAKTKGKRG